jgi:uncharacterized protein YndB with AHSA1/START domain
MSFQNESGMIRWRIHLKSPPEEVYSFLATDTGRAAFWAESAAEVDGKIRFQFPDGQIWNGRVLVADPPETFQVEYFGGSVTTFRLSRDPIGGTDLLLTDEGVNPEDRLEVIAGWVSVLMALKAAVDYGIDLRNHNPQRTWNQGYADN